MTSRNLDKKNRNSITAKNAPKAFHLLAKPTGASCNLNCSYCFFLDKKMLYPGSWFRMSEELLEQYIKQLVEAHQVDQVTVSWQGGEPTMMGLDFYRRSIEFEKKYSRPGMAFLNTMQTNGVLLDDEWCRFFKENNFLIGISIDGPEELHNAYRVDKRGKPTFKRVMKGLQLLQKHRVEYNVLTAVNNVNSRYPQEVYEFLCYEAKTDWIQFIPVVERINKDGRFLYQEGDTVSERSVLPEQLGNFLSIIFDKWVRNDVGKVYVQTFEAAARNWFGMPASGMCVFNENCGLGPVLEHNGDLYSCDHFVEPKYLIGNIQETHMSELMASKKQQKFGRDKSELLPDFCLECDVLFACRGECPKNRFKYTPPDKIHPEGQPGLNYLCAGFKHFFHHINEPMKIIADLIRRGKPASDVMGIIKEKDKEWAQILSSTGRNDPCPCGSGKKFKKCHGTGYKFKGISNTK
jgi:uncharacterized protein